MKIIKTLVFFWIGTYAMTSFANQINFADPGEINSWRVVNDEVMGGNSLSRVEINDGVLSFLGYVSLENNGGFASIRRMGVDSVYGAKVIKLRIRTDAKTYKIRLRTNQTLDSVAYSADITAKAGAWTEVVLNESDFTATWRGRVINDAPALRLKDVQQVGFLIADKQEGNFRLDVSRILITK